MFPINCRQPRIGAVTYREPLMEPRQPGHHPVGNASRASGAPMSHTTCQLPDEMETISAAYQVLFYIKSSASFQQLLDSLPPDTPGFLMKQLVYSFLSYLAESQSDTFFAQGSTRGFETVDSVFHNSTVSPRWLADGPSSHFHIQQGLGHQDCLRWDVIGIIYATVALSLTIGHDLSDSNGGASQPDSRARVTILKDLTHAVNTCIRFQEMTGTKTELYLWLLIQDIVLLIRIYGGKTQNPIDRRVWRRLGDIGNALFTIGLHKPSFRNQVITAMHIRQQLFLTAYTLDKAITTLMKRPPRIPRQNCMELDNISLSVSAADWINLYISTRLSQALSSPVSLVEKVSFAMSIVREDVQVARSTLTDSPEFSAPQNMTRLLEDVWQLLKVSSDIRPENWQMERFPHQGYILLIVYLEYLYTRSYIMQHLPPAQAYTLGGLCRKILWTMICGMQSLGHLKEYRSDYTWRLILYGLPSAEMLASLLQPHSEQVSQATSISNSSAKGAVISELNTFFSCIRTVVRPNDAHYSDCQEAQQKINASLAQAADLKTILSEPHSYESTTLPTL